METLLRLLICILDTTDCCCCSLKGPLVVVDVVVVDVSEDTMDDGVLIFGVHEAAVVVVFKLPIKGVSLET